MNNLNLISGEKLSLRDIGEECIVGTIIVTDEKLFQKNFKKFLQVVEKAFYKYGYDWNDIFTRILKKLNLGFKKNKLNKSVRYVNIQDIAPHHEYLK